MSELYFGSPGGDWVRLEGVSTEGFTFTPDEEEFKVVDYKPFFKYSFEHRFENIDPLLLAALTGIKPKRKRDRKRWEAMSKQSVKWLRDLYRQNQRSQIGIYK